MSQQRRYTDDTHDEQQKINQNSNVCCIFLYVTESCHMSIACLILNRIV